MIYSWKEIQVSIFTKTRREDVYLPHAKRWNSSFYHREDNNEVNHEDNQREFGYRVAE